MKSLKLLFILMSSSVYGYTPYWFNPKIHNFGNIGLGGKIHANSALFFTKMIDLLAYNNTDIRYEMTQDIPHDKKVCDFGCGIGLSTHEGVNSIGIDTSNEMIEVANRLFPNKNFIVANAENYGKTNEFDIVTISFLFHEVPYDGRNKIIDNALRISKDKIIIMDISPQYIPSKQMLSGEPYILEYCININKQIFDYPFKIKNIELAPGRANKWILSKKIKNSFI